MAKRRKFIDHFKATVALETLRGDKAIQEIAVKHQVHPNQVSTWKRQAVEGMADLFARGGKPVGPTEAEVKELHAKIGRFAVKNKFFRKGSKGEPGKEALDQELIIDSVNLRTPPNFQFLFRKWV